MKFWMQYSAQLLVFLIFIIAVVLFGNYLKSGDMVPEWTVPWMDNLPWQHKWLVLRVVDGDSTLIRYKGKMTAVQLVYVNAPEKGKPHWEESRDALMSKIAGQRVELRFRDPGVEERDFYGRLLACIHLDDRSINLEMIREGFARYRHDDNAEMQDLDLMNAEREAREHKLGLWGIQDDALTEG